MQLSPLQSRLAASLGASVLLVVLYLVLFAPNVALAAEAIVSGDDGPHVALEGLDRRREGLVDATYEPEFDAFDRSIIGRAAEGVELLGNNVVRTFNLMPGASKYFVFQSGMISERSEHWGDGESRREETETDTPREPAGAELRRRQASGSAFVSANTCQHPFDSTSDTPEHAPQLQLHVGTSSTDTFPGPDQDLGAETVDFTEGAVMYKTGAGGDIHFGITAPNVTAGATGIYVFEVAASVDGWYHSYVEESPEQLLWMNSDATGALFVTRDSGFAAMPDDMDAAREVMREDPPYVMFAEKQGSAAVDGVRYSFCGLQSYAEMAARRQGRTTGQVSMGMTTAGGVPAPRQRFHFKGLEPSSTYSGILVHTGRSGLGRRQEGGEVGGGGQVFQGRQFQTNEDDNCKIVSGLEFCDNIGYSVPANDRKLNSTDDSLGRFYDEYVRGVYANFEKSLKQISCTASDYSRYSLIHTCDDCRRAYRNWLCTVAIPRCQSFTSADAPSTLVRNVAQAFPNGTVLAELDRQAFQDPWHQASRNRIIDERVSPGPYREVLPCDDLCYDVVRSCPAALGFQCPLPGMPGFEQSYARVRPGDDDSCNGQDLLRSGASTASVSVGVVLVAACAALLGAL